MSQQQINLLNPVLRQRRDALSLALVLGGCLLVLLVEAGFFAAARYQNTQLSQRETALSDEVKAMQLGVGTLEKNIAERKPNARLAADLSALQATIAPRQEALAKLQQANADEARISEALRGFSRQSLSGVWLTEVAVHGNELLIRGRLLEAALLPVYIRRLNGEPAFHGRSFASLEMKGVEAAPLPPPALTVPVVSALLLGTAAPAAVVKPPLRQPAYVEFALQSSLPEPAAAVGAAPLKLGGGF